MNLNLKIITFLLLLTTAVLGDIVHDDIKLVEDGDFVLWTNNSFTFSIAASASMSETMAITLPVADGSAGQQLTTDGNNVWSWVDPGGAGGAGDISEVGDVTNGAAFTQTSSGNSLWFEGATADDFEIELTGADATTPDKTITLPDITGTVILSGHTFSTDVTGTLDTDASTILTVTNDSHDHTGSTLSGIDIFDDTNLAVDTDHLKLTDDTLSFSDNEKVVSHARQDSFLEQIDFTISEAGGTVTGSLEKETGGDLTQFWSDDFDVLDCTPAKTVDLTGSVGTDTSPAAAFVYILFSAKTTLVVNSSWPADSVEHIRVASIVLQSAATTGTNGALMNRNWNDKAFGISNPKGGAILSNERMRVNHAQWDSGVLLTVTGDGTSTITLDTTGGFVYQLNRQAFPAIDMAGADDIHIVNQTSNAGTAYEKSVNLFDDITHVADGSGAGGGGSAIGNNKFFNLVIWGVQNRTGETSHLMCNIPIGQYGKQGDAIVDAEKFSVHTIPDDFRGTGFLIGELTFQFSSGGGGTWTLIQERSLLGHFPILIPGGGTTSIISTFVDSAFEIFDNGDDTKRIAFQVSSVGAGNTSVITVPDNNVDLADIATNTAHITADGSSHTFIDQDVTTTADVSFATVAADTTFRAGAGSQNAPSFAFTGDINTGMWNSDSNKLNFATGGFERLEINGNEATFTVPVDATAFIIGSASINEAELETIDGVTPGTVTASKAIIVDASKNITGMGTITCGLITSAANDLNELRRDRDTTGTTQRALQLIRDTNTTSLATSDGTGIRIRAEGLARSEYNIAAMDGLVEGTPGNLDGCWHFYTADNGALTLALILDSNQDAVFTGSVDMSGGTVTVGTSIVGGTSLDITAGDDGVFSTTIRDDTTATAANVFINATTGVLARSTSSARRKRDIVDVPENINPVLRPRRFRSTSAGDDPNKEYFGLIAEEVYEVLPEAVVMRRPVINNSDPNNIIYGEPEPDAIDWNMITTMLIKKNQRLKTQLQALEQRVTIIESR